MIKFSDIDGKEGELVFEILLDSNIGSIIDLDLSENIYWFNKPDFNNGHYLAELIAKQVNL